jgi:outer membrane lipoprotein-sorting protein
VLLVNSEEHWSWPRGVTAARREDSWRWGGPKSLYFHFGVMRGGLPRFWGIFGVFPGRFVLNWKQAFSTLGLAALVLSLGFSSHASAVQTRGPISLEAALRELDSAAKNFHSLSADMERTKVTVVVNDKSTETGSILVHENKMLLELKPPDARTILRTGDTLYVYTPGLKRVEEYNLAQHRALVDQYLLLGFGTSGHELQKLYLVTLLGEPTLEDKKVVELELTPKSQDARGQISKIQIWLDESSWLPVQQQFFETGSGDYFVIRYTKMVRNPKIGDSEFKPKWPKGTETIKPQG